MDALKLFYETKFGAQGRAAPERVTHVVAASRAAEAEDGAETLLRHMEQHAGRPLRSRAAIDAYLAARTAPREQPRSGERSLLRETMLVLFLVVAVLQYYYIDVSLEIASLKNVTVFVPVEQVHRPSISAS